VARVSVFGTHVFGTRALPQGKSRSGLLDRRAVPCHTQKSIHTRAHAHAHPHLQHVVAGVDHEGQEVHVGM
jgi:hypothetical protein